jgi:hypothetical protein
MMKKELMDGEQIINGRKIIFPTFCGGEIDRSLNTKEDIKEYIQEVNWKLGFER